MVCTIILQIPFSIEEEPPRPSHSQVRAAPCTYKTPWLATSVSSSCLVRLGAAGTTQVAAMAGHAAAGRYQVRPGEARPSLSWLGLRTFKVRRRSRTPRSRTKIEKTIVEEKKNRPLHCNLQSLLVPDLTGYWFCHSCTGLPGRTGKGRGRGRGHSKRERECEATETENGSGEGERIRMRT